MSNRGMALLMIFLISALAACSSTYEESTLQEVQSIHHLEIDSKVLGRKMNVNVYVPQGYSKDSNMAILYVLHPKNGDENSILTGQLDMGRRADKLIEQGEIDPIIIVAPELHNSYGVNSADTPGKKNEYDMGRYEDYFIQEMLPEVESQFANSAIAKEQRYIGGLSMGGYAALHYAFKYDGLFSKVGGHSAAVWREVPDYLSWLYKDKTNQVENDPVLLVSKGIGDDAMRIYLDHGAKEYKSIADGNRALMEKLDEHKVTYVFKLNPGGHNKKYWASQMDNYLKFYAGTSEEN
ncbi:alpha/beta hydrolase [Paenibacillus sp. GCM10023252]|uniref:alpha/beta hydrolase n=1 Tax=Paenibacillus sp. GCM10023252 TaxID=3252649 RepID=UPI003619DB72